jgi:signal transduction histidine kinase/CheY-like chemotaxis protein
MEFAPHEMRVLVLAPTQVDAEVSLRVLAEAGIAAEICDSATAAREITRGAGALIVTDEKEGRDPLVELRFLLDRQPSWSELPILVLARAESPRLDELRGVPGVVLLERPVHIRSMVSAVQAALRARRRQYELRNQLERTNAINLELQNQARAKDEFLATLSHELRNPLSALSTAASLLDREQITPNVEHTARQVVKRQTALMGRLLDDLLDVSRITRGRLEIRKVRTELSAIVKAAVETVQPLLTRKGHTFSVTLPDRDTALEADPVRMAQVLANLLTNAAKYTEPKGKIELLVRREADSVEFRVRDDGIGIAEHARADIFKMFSQLSPAIERSEGGLGIGLALAKGLVELHGGTISVASEGLGRGSEFTVKIPCEKGTPMSAITESNDRRCAPPPKRCKVLVADDNADALESLAMLLELEGHEVRVACDGPTAVALMRQQTCDVVLLDIGMPGMNGYEVAREIRKLDGGDAVMLVALTGWGQPSDRARAREAGFDHHLTKPVEFEELALLLQHVCESPPKTVPQLRLVNT